MVAAAPAPTFARHVADRLRGAATSCPTTTPRSASRATRRRRTSRRRTGRRRSSGTRTRTPTRRSAPSAASRKSHRREPALALPAHASATCTARACDAQAFKVLSDPNERAHYDRYGDEPAARPRGPRGAHQPMYADELSPEDIFNMFFGMPPTGGRHGGGGFHRTGGFNRRPGGGVHVHTVGNGGILQAPRAKTALRVACGRTRAAR